ncbi:MAG TPA: hypothetical protein VNT81_10740 [Vicinamibacterales bacterium]|nr:hypothetical protein [Vicinamibacterales bacterium]
MTPNRRQFVAALATVPLVVQSASAQRRTPVTTADPVLEQIVAELRALAGEFENAQPGTRKSLLRAMESTLGAGAAHLQANYDAGFQAALRRRESRGGRAALVHELMLRGHDARQHNMTHEAIDAAMTRAARQGLSGSFRNVQQTLRRIRLQAPDQIQAASLTSVQYDYCADLNWMISNMEGMVMIVCAIAVLEPTWGGEIPCAALTLALGLLLVQRSWFC